MASINPLQPELSKDQKPKAAQENELDVNSQDVEAEAMEMDSQSSDDMPNDEKWDEGKQVRGPQLREKMIQSERDGEDYRASHQGSDLVRENFNAEKLNP